MKTKLAHKIKLAALAVSLAAFAPTLFAQITIPFADGSDGALNITSNTVIDLSQAGTGVWTNTSASPTKGTYDPTQWAVVFKYSSVTIASNVTVTFLNHPTHAPVVWLVATNATINGIVSLDGQSYNGFTANVAEPGPGGFRGGLKFQTGFGIGGGFGPGGYYNDAGSYSTYHPYGNAQIVPLVGGSGGAASYGSCTASANGGAGGGALLIAASGTITVNGYCHANGGNGNACSYGNGVIDSFNGSGGAIRMIANQILGVGKIEAAGGNSLESGNTSYPGRIRLEANTTSGTLTLNPSTSAVLPSPLVIFPGPTAPTVQVLSVFSIAAPADPKASISGSGDDITIAQTNAVAIQLQTANFPTNGTVNVYLKPLTGPQSILQASFVSGNTNLATWQLNTILPVSHGIIQARAVAP